DFLWAGLHYGVAFLAYEMLFVALAFTLFLMVNQRLLTDLEEDIDRRRQAEEELRRSHAQLELRVDERTRELSRSNAALHESEEKFRRMAASARDAILMVDDAGRLTYWNEAAGTMFGYAADEALGQDLHLLLAPACHHEPYQRGYLQFRETGTGPVIGALQTLTARRKDATEFPIELAIAPLQLQGRWHALGMVRDITARQKTEAALRQAHDELEHRVQERTAALERANAELRAAQAEAKRLLTVTEQSRRVLLSMVEDQNAAVMKLRESEERFRRAVVDAPFPIMLHAEDGAVLQVSESWCEITGYTEAELATIADWTERAYGERRQRVQADIDALYRLDHRKHEGDYAIRTKSGAVRIWEFSSAPLGRLPDGRRLVISMALDVTERRNAEREIRTLNAELEQRVRERTVELEAANKELEAFSYSVSHDLRAPLRGIDGWSAALVEDYGKTLDATAGEYLERVRSEAQRMGRLIDDLLRLSRVSRAELRREAVDLSALARTVAERLRGAWPGRRIEFVIASDLMTEGDAALLEVVLTNLLDNACKFTGPRAEARIEFGGWPGEVEPPSALSGGSTPPIPLAAAKSSFVRDNGVGFDPAYAGRLFGAFQRMHKEDDFPGTGVGLATVHRIIRRHGGWIRAESHLGQGATFYFTLSAASADGRERRPGPPGSAGPDDAPAMTPPHES
ncbi:MAG: PAS domain S-box protein, partial [Verrucomicrobia bacterium]|nr:PAS domain S-box protein [Verrucomicrobiota bacterium]